MKPQLTGSEFVRLVSQTNGEELKYKKWIALLYDVLEANGECRVFKELAFEAKSFQRLSRLLDHGILDRTAKGKVGDEIKGALERFSKLLEGFLSHLQKEARIQFEEEFLHQTPISLENLVILLGDFSKIKDFYLMERDLGGIK